MIKIDTPYISLVNHEPFGWVAGDIVFIHRGYEPDETTSFSYLIGKQTKTHSWYVTEESLSKFFVPLEEFTEKDKFTLLMTNQYRERKVITFTAYHQSVLGQELYEDVSKELCEEVGDDIFLFFYGEQYAQNR